MNRSRTRTRSLRRWLALCVLGVVACPVFGGCAAITNPVANGIPVRRLPPELLAEPKGDKVETPLEWLRQEQPKIYRLAPNDILGIYIEGVLGSREQLPPVNIPIEGDHPPALGFPIPVREDGTVPLPLIDPVRVEGMSITEAEQAIINAYTVDKKILQRDRERIIVTLFQPRTTRVLVIRQDSPDGGGVNISSRGPLNRSGLGSISLSAQGRQGTGTVVDLPAYQNDVLNALTRTGGLPGSDAVNEVVVRRGGFQPDDANGQLVWDDEADKTRIPLRMRRGEQPPFTKKDIILNNGDIVFIAAREAELFYTGGLLPSGEVPLPRDYDLDAVEAVLRVGGPFFNGGINSSNLNGSITASGIGRPSPSQLTVVRRLPTGETIPIKVDLTRAVKDPRENILIQSADLLILQETPGEATARYFSEVFNVNIFGRFLDRADASGAATVLIP